MEETFPALQIQDVSTKNSCYKCGFSFPHKGKPCSAKKAICFNCGVKGHFAKVCRTPKSAPTKKHHPWTQSQDLTPGSLTIKRSLGKVKKPVKFQIHLQMNLVHQMMNMPTSWKRNERITHTKRSYVSEPVYSRTDPKWYGSISHPYRFLLAFTLDPIQISTPFTLGTGLEQFHSNTWLERWM